MERGYLVARVNAESEGPNGGIKSFFFCFYMYQDLKNQLMEERDRNGKEIGFVWMFDRIVTVGLAYKTTEHNKSAVWSNTQPTVCK